MKKKFILDLTKDRCPIAFIKTREFLSESPREKDKFLVVSTKSTLNDLESTLKELKICFSVTKKLKNFVIKIKKIKV